MMSRKLETPANKMVYPEGTFLWWELFIPSFKPIAYLVDKQREECRGTFCYRDYVHQVSKLQHIQRFYPLCCNETTNLKNDTSIWIRIHILHLLYMTSLSDLYFNKKYEHEKKSLCKSTFKSIFVDTYYLLYVIIVTECGFVSPSTKFSSLHHKKVVVLWV